MCLSQINKMFFIKINLMSPTNQLVSIKFHTTQKKNKKLQVNSKISKYAFFIQKLVSLQLQKKKQKMYEQHLYKQQLYNTLANDQGLVDNVKLQLREKIINRLKTSSNTTKSQQPQRQFVRKVCMSLFNQFLTTERLFHTLAVFTPQCGLGKGILKKQQLRQLLKINGQDTQKSSLQQIITKYLPKNRLIAPLVSTSCQTDDKQTIQNLQNKLAHIDFQYKQKQIDGLKNVQDTQQRFLKLKNDLNKRYKQQLELEIKRLRDFEIARVRLEEQQKSKLNLQQYKQQLQLSYQKKLQKLRQREAQVMTRVANKMKQVETYNYQMRQNMLKDFQHIKLKEEQLERLKEQLLSQQRKNVSGM